MFKLLLLAIAIFLAIVFWFIGNSFSPDALAMAVGILFGMSAGIPAALLVLVSGRDNQTNGARPGAWDEGYRAGLLEASRQAALDYDRERPSVWIVDNPQLDHTGAIVARRDNRHR
jgi:hypothetical protein